MASSLWPLHADMEQEGLAFRRLLLSVICFLDLFRHIRSLPTEKKKRKRKRVLMGLAKMADQQPSASLFVCPLGSNN